MKPEIVVVVVALSATIQPISTYGPVKPEHLAKSIFSLLFYDSSPQRHSKMSCLKESTPLLS